METSHLGVDRTIFRTTYEAQVAHAAREQMATAVEESDAEKDDFVMRRDRRSGTHSKIATIVSKLYRETNDFAFVYEQSRPYVKSILGQHWEAVDNATFNEFRGNIPDSVAYALGELWQYTRYWPSE